VTIACLADRSDGSDLPANVTVLIRPLADASVVPGTVNPFRARSRTRLAAILRGVSWLWRYVRNLRSWGRSAAASCGPVDLWHANDLTGLAAIGPFAERHVPIVYDVHDLILETGTAVRLPGLARRLLGRYERRLVARVAAFVTVNMGLADVLESRFSGRRIEVVHNCPERWAPEQPSVGSRIRDAAGIDRDAPIILYHGGLAAGRGIEELMDAILVPGLEHAHLVLMGFGEQRDRFLEMAAERDRAGRVHVLDPVPPSHLLAWVASADVGAVVHPGSRVNDYLKTPNKLFECLAAGVPVVGSDFPLMRQIILDDPSGPLGSTADPSDPEAIGAALHAILGLGPADSQALRDRCLTAAHNRWNWELESARLTELYADLLAAKP
jgi:glycosyltransferase involved in cell wall biosynthesis